MSDRRTYEICILQKDTENYSETEFNSFFCAKTERYSYLCILKRMGNTYAGGMSSEIFNDM